MTKREPITTDDRVSYLDAGNRLVVYDVPVSCHMCRKCLASRAGRCMYGGPFLAACLMMISGCASDDAPLLPMRAPIPANLVSPCPPLTPLEDGSGASVLRKLVEVSEVYHDCRRKHEALVQAVQPAAMTESQ